MRSLMVNAWYRGAWWLNLLRPLSALFVWLARMRRQRQRSQVRPAQIPVIVVGNVSVGGTGKTPVVLALSNALQRSGLRTGVLSRGYGGRARQYPYFVKADSDVRATGDEALLLRRYLRGPLVLDPDRARGLAALENAGSCDVVICDDGLQHYRLWRDIEVVVMDAQRGIGNGLCLPAGPLREPPARLAEVDFIVVNGAVYDDPSIDAPAIDAPASDTPAKDALSKDDQSVAATDWRAAAAETPVSPVQLVPHEWVNVKTGQRVALQEFLLAQELTDMQGSKNIYAVAGIGNPQRFFTTLQELGIQAACHEFADHHLYQPRDLAFAGQALLLMTEKDAVKCEQFAGNNWWYLSVQAQLSKTMLQQLGTRLDAVLALRTHDQPATGGNGKWIKNC